MFHCCATAVPHFLVWCRSTTGVSHMCLAYIATTLVWHTCVIKTGVAHQFVHTGVVFVYSMSYIHGWFSFGTPVTHMFVHTSCTPVAQLYVWHTCMGSYTKLLSGVTQVCPHISATLIAKVWHTTGAFTYMCMWRTASYISYKTCNTEYCVLSCPNKNFKQHCIQETCIYWDVFFWETIHF